MTECTRCGLYKTRHSVSGYTFCLVTGMESVVPIVLIGDAPGRSEDLVGSPMTGSNRQMLNMMLHAAWHGVIPYMLTNTVQCWTGDVRDPSKEELAACRPNVMAAIAHASPNVVVYIGAFARRAMRKDLSHLKQFQIVHPAMVLKGGGISSPYYLHNVRILERAAHAINQ